MHVYAVSMAGHCPWMESSLLSTGIALDRHQPPPQHLEKPPLQFLLSRHYYCKHSSNRGDSTNRSIVVAITRCVAILAACVLVYCYHGTSTFNGSMTHLLFQCYYSHAIAPEFTGFIHDIQTPPWLYRTHQSYYTLYIQQHAVSLVYEIACTQLARTQQNTFRGPTSCEVSGRGSCEQSALTFQSNDDDIRTVIAQGPREAERAPTPWNDVQQARRRRPASSKWF